MSEHKTTTPEPIPGSSVSRRILLRGGTAALLGVAGASALASCSTSGPSVAEATSKTQVAAATGAGAAPDYSALRGKTVGVIAAAGTSESVARIIKTAQKIGTENGFNVDTVDTNGDYKKASDTLKLFANKGYAAALSAVVDPNLMKDGSASLEAKNIPFGGCFAGNGPGLSFDVTSN
jgi:ABC-type sugar transport system substrate-binding protein